MDTPEETHNQLGDVFGASVQAGHIESVTIASAPAALPVPRHVPPVTGRFVNREADFARADEVAGTSAVRVGLVSGQPGVGKSWFARRFAERTVPRYPGGQLYADFSSSPKAQAPSDVLTGFLTSLGVAKEAIPARLSEQANLYRTLTARRSVLVVLDEVTDAAQVRPFVPAAPGSVVLVTSNDRFDELVLDGAEPVPLKPFDPAHAIALLADLVGDRITTEPDAAAELVEQCDGLPVALQVAARRLQASPSLPVARLVAEIADENRGLRAFTIRGHSRVAAVFTVAYNALSEPVARMYRRASLLPGHDFSVELAAAAAALPVADAADLLAELVALSLLTEDDSGRFRFPSLVRRHAREQAEASDSEPVRTAALRRTVYHMLVVAAFADLTALGPDRLRCTPHELLLAGHENPFQGKEKSAALDWLDRERPTAMALLRVAVDKGWFDLAWQLAESMTAVFVVRRYLVDWTEFSEWGARAAVADEAPGAEARLRSFVSRAWTDLGDLPRARRELETALRLAEPLGQLRLTASVHEMWGRWYDAAGEPGEAVASYRRAMELFGAAQDERGGAFVQYFLGASLAGQGREAEALTVLGEARARIRELGDGRMEGRALMSLGEAQHRLGRADEAFASVRAAVERFETGRFDFYQARAEELLAEFAEHSGDSAAAASSLRRAVELHRKMRSPRLGELEARLETLG